MQAAVDQRRPVVILLCAIEPHQRNGNRFAQRFFLQIFSPEGLGLAVFSFRKAEFGPLVKLLQIGLSQGSTRPLQPFLIFIAVRNAKPFQKLSLIILDIHSFEKFIDINVKSKFWIKLNCATPCGNHKLNRYNLF